MCLRHLLGLKPRNQSLLVSRIAGSDSFVADLMSVLQRPHQSVSPPRLEWTWQPPAETTGRLSLINAVAALRLLPLRIQAGIAPPMKILSESQVHAGSLVTDCVLLLCTRADPR